MKIYTKSGDDGSTGLFGGVRVRKDDVRVEAYGTVDELNSTLALAVSTELDEEMSNLLRSIQSDLFTLGAELATPPRDSERLAKRSRTLGEPDIARLEQAIDAAEEQLPPLQQFVLPGGSPQAAALHQARSVCRRAERRVLSLQQAESVRQDVLIYLNRLSDLLFVLARLSNLRTGVPDVPWQPPKE